jgi:uncharacterized protein YbjT (DUF2867 family)
VILITGATGNVGGEMVRALASQGEPVRALTRSGGADAFPAGVEIARGDLNDPASLVPALDGVTSLFLLPGYADMPDLLAEAGRAGTRTVVLLSGMSADGDMDNAITRYMAESEQAVRASGIAWTILRPAMFMTNAFQWISQLQAGDLVRAPFPAARAAVIDPADIAAVAALALTAPGHAGRVYKLSGPESLTAADRVAILGRVLHRDLSFEAEPDDEARAMMLETTPPPYVDAFFRFYADGTLDESQVLPTVGDLTGRPPGTFERWATAHLPYFT